MLKRASSALNRNLLLALFLIVGIVTGYTFSSIKNVEEVNHVALDWSAYTVPDYQQAITSFETALEKNQNDAEAYNGLGWVYIELERFEEARDNFQRAIDIDNTNDRYYAGLGGSYYLLGDFEAAQSPLDIALNINENNLLAHDYKGLVHFANQQYDLAEISFSRSIGIDPHRALPHTGLGWVYTTDTENPDIERIESEFNQAIELNPTDERAYHGLAYAYLNFGKTSDDSEQRWRESLHNVEIAIKLDPDYGSAYETQGVAQWKLQQYDEAIESFEKAIELNADEPWRSYSGLGAIYLEQDRYADAEAAFKQALQLHSTMWIHEYLGRALYAQGKLVEANQQFQTAFNLEPTVEFDLRRKEFFERKGIEFN